jgi:hypothetical protein
MRVQDFESVSEVTSEEQIQEQLVKRYEGDVNAFWLSHGSDKFPVISILAKNGLAALHYFPKDRHPGFRSCGHVLDSRKSMFMKFHASPHEEQDVLSASVVSADAALEAAKEFSKDTSLPRSIVWFEL